ncbi:MAG: hypothetical protein ACI3XA_00415 [Clostridia bacterium]
MKKIFAVMVFVGFVLAAATAGGVDAGMLSVDRILIQGVMASILMLGGTLLIKRGERV